MSQAAHAVHAAGPSSGAGTPLMNLASYLLYAECALILLLSVPLYVPMRRQLLEWIHYSPRLWTVRVVIGCVHAFVAMLLGDTYLRLNRTTLQIEGIQASHANAMNAPLAAAQGGIPAAAAPVQPALQSTVDAAGNIANLNDLFSARFRGQRDLYVLAFTLFCSTVLFQLHMLLIKMDKFKNQRDEARAELARKDAPAAAALSSADDQTLPADIQQPVNQFAASVKNATHAVSEKVDALLHRSHPAASASPATVVAAVPAPAESHGEPLPVAVPVGIRHRELAVPTSQSTAVEL